MSLSDQNHIQRLITGFLLIYFNTIVPVHTYKTSSWTSFRICELFYSRCYLLTFLTLETLNFQFWYLRFSFEGFFNNHDPQKIIFMNGGVSAADQLLVMDY